MIAESRCQEFAFYRRFPTYGWKEGSSEGVDGGVAAPGARLRVIAVRFRILCAIEGAYPRTLYNR